MKFSEIVSITGVSGLKRVIGQRKDGLIVSDLDGNNKKFIPSRTHLFSPLESISIYTIEDSTPLLEILLKMKDTEIVDEKSDNDTLRTFMKNILPNYDEDKVHINDIKKLIRWFHTLQAYDLIQEEKKEEQKSTEE